MIIRRATQVVAWGYHAKECNAVAPRSVARGAPRSGDRATAGMPDRLKVYVGRQQPATGSHLPLKKLLHPTRSRSILPQPLWNGALQAVCLVRLLAKERPRAQPEEPRKAGIGQRRGCQDRAKNLLGRLHPAAGSHLPSEETAPPFAVVPFTSSPFAHPIPQSHRRASGDLFRTSLTISSSGIRCRR
jgi:hypothetical protein